MTKNEEIFRRLVGADGMDANSRLPKLFKPIFDH
jgi:hypothetical protein